MIKLFATLALTASMAWPLAVPAQNTAPGIALYQAFGEKEGIRLLMDDFVNRLFADPRIGTMFKDTKPANLKEQLTDQICQLTGGPCKYEGDTMKRVHADLGIRKADFNALVDILQAAMAVRDIPFMTQNQLLALLAPMHRDIITR